MALVERLAILITGDATGAISALKDVASSAETNAAKADVSASKFSGTATKIGAGMMAAGAGLLSIGISAANTTTDLGREVLKLQRYTGMNAEAASQLAYAAKMSGVDVESLATGIGKLSKTMSSSPEKLTKLGVEAKTSDGHLRSMTDVLGDVADKFKSMGPGTEATAASLELFGRSGANLLPFLLKGKDGIAELSAEAEKMGLVLSQDNVDQVKANIVAQRQLHAAIDGVKVQIGNQMLPILTKFTTLMTNLPGPIKDIAGPIVVLGGAVLVTGGAFLLMAGQVQKAKAAYAGMSSTAQTATNVMGLVGAAVAVATTAYTVMQGSVDRARAAQEKANDGVLAAAAGSGYQALSDELLKTHAANKKLYDGLDVWKTLTRWDPWNAFAEAGKMQGLDKLDEQLGVARASAIALSDSQHISLDTATVWLAKMAEGGTVFPTVADAVAGYTGKIDTNKASTDEAASAQDGYAAAIKHASDVLRATTDPIFAVMNAQDSLTEAQTNYDNIKNDSTKTDAAKEAALRKLWTASFDLTDAQTKLGGALASGDVSSDKLGAALDTLRLNNIDPTTEAGQALTEKIYGVDETAKIVAELLKGRVLRAETDESNLQAFLDKLNEIKTKHIEVQDWIFTHDIGSKGNGLGFRLPQASGGYVPGGGARLVGEHGPELFVPSSSGSIVNALSTEHALGGGGGGSTMTINITMPPGTDGANVVEAIRRYERMNGPGWRN